jgi:hypothetical protein
MIDANRRLAIPVLMFSDGIVAYTSIYSDQAASEPIIPAGHGAFRLP